VSAAPRWRIHIYRLQVDGDGSRRASVGGSPADLSVAVTRHLDRLLRGGEDPGGDSADVAAVAAAVVVRALRDRGLRVPGPNSTPVPPPSPQQFQPRTGR
jgi:hypothetical protein